MTISRTFTLVGFDQQQIERIAQTVAGGASNVESIYPLSPLQEGMLFHRLLNERSDTYVLSVLFGLKTRAELSPLVDALQRVIDRHEVLRSSVLWENLPHPVHVVYRQARLPVEEFALDSKVDSMTQLRERMKPRQRRLSLRAAPLLCLEVAADPACAQWYALLHVHHLICDHQSLQTVVTEALTFLRGRGRELSKPVLFSEHVLQARERAQAQDAQAFFRRKLADVDETTAPFGLLNVHGDGSQIEEARQGLDPALVQRVRAQARRVGVSVARLFHAAWSVVIARTSGKSDIVFGTVVLAAERRSARVQRVVGMSVNTLPLRLRLSDITVEQLVRQASDEVQELLQYEKTSLVLAQSCSSAGNAPLFTAILNYRHNAPGQPSESLDAAGVRVLARGEAWTNYPITLTVDDFGSEMELISHTDRRIEPRRVAGYLETALHSLIDALERAPTTAAMSLSILSSAEQRELLESLNATAAPMPRTQLIHALFEEQVSRTPNATAVVHKDDSLTYAELDRKANQLAARLRARGVGADRLVGLCAARSLEMVVGLLGILKAGGAYIPLDPNYPAERLQYMLRDSKPCLVLADERLVPTLRDAGAPVLPLRETIAQISNDAGETPAAAGIGLSAANLLYVIYTSGSTGRPKGTAMPHGAMANLIEWHRTAFGDRNRARVLQFAALSFDVAFQEMFSTLCTGGTLVLPDDWVRRDPRSLYQLLIEQRVSRLFLPPMMLQSIAESAREVGAVPSDLEDVIAAGEQLRLSPEIVALFKRMGSCRLHNHYGPTETHVVTAMTLSGDPERWPVLPSIGVPIANTQIYVLDDRRDLVPIGVIGEIYIAGANLARGYLNRPELIAERFVRNPFGIDPAARMYRTGDLGRWSSDGTIDYLGRNDDQVKIRGFRVELGEIEAQLAAHPEVKEAAVIAVQGSTGGKRLVAYVTARNDNAPSAHTLHWYLRSVLPEHMVPAAFVALPSLPVTPSGKLNRRALPAPPAQAYVTRAYERPRGETEELLAEIWQELLQVGDVGRDDQFFELGGHSLLAMQVVSRIQRTFSIRLSIKALFDHPTLRALAFHVDSLRRARLLESVSDGGADLQELLETVTSMPESEVQQLLRTLATEGRP